MRCKNDYQLPINQEYIERFRKKSPRSHIGRLRHALDFYASEGTPIYAALDGAVVYVKQNSDTGGRHRKYWSSGNRIEIRHKNEEYTAYEHLMYKGVIVKPGQKVKAGQVIGYVGDTGYCSSPHLHLEVFRYNGAKKYKNLETLMVSFKEFKGK